MPDQSSPTFNEFLTEEVAKIDLARVSINLLIAAGLAFVLGWVYVRFGRTASNRRLFAGQFVIITMTTALIRGGQVRYDLDATSLLSVGDTVVLIGPAESLAAAIKVFSEEAAPAPGATAAIGD